ncbi:MAG: iron-containing alcohol dehydrogenase, partial [Methanocorpusculum sp.]|nr:iron-containing alcohol dehydrogenase [Methanocorpusculum sp.]
MNSFCNTEIVFSDKSTAEDLLLSRTGENVVLLLSESADMRWGLKTFRNSLEKQSNIYVWVKSVPANPTQNDILQVLRIIGGQYIDTVIAIGGGSTIDLAKALSIFSNSEKNNTYTLDEISACIRNKSYVAGSCIDIIAVPTTAGTGSELTQWATIWDANKLG